MIDSQENFSEQPPPSEPFVPDSLVKKMYFRVKRWYRTCRSYLIDPHYQELSRSGLFDARYYLHNDPSLNPRYIDPLIHYLEAGWQEGRKPNRLFDSGYYHDLNPECAESEPLLHYIAKGWREGANPTPLFFTSWYAQQYPESTRRGKSPLSHYLKTGWRKSCRPNPYTDLTPYLEAHPEFLASGVNPLAHYVDCGYQDKSGPLPFFDAGYYLEDNPSAGWLAMTPLAHYLQYGVREGRSPSRFFDPDYYLEHHPEAGPSQLTAFLHFNSTGHEKDFRPNRLFDSAYYSRAYPDSVRSNGSPLFHYQDKGVLSGNYPCPEVAELVRKPVISIVTPVYDTDALLLRRCIHSVLYQAYPHWELCLVDDGSKKAHVRDMLAQYARLDKRIRVRFLEKNLGIAGASTAAAEMAGGEYIAFLDHDDELTPDALYEVAKALNEHDPDIIYTDEDLVNLESRHLDSFFKPDYNPELLLTHNYITHLLVTRRELFLRTGGFSSEYEGAQDFDLVLKLTEQADRIFHIPRQLYHWRASETSTSVNHTQKTYADAAGRKALEAALQRRGIRATVEQGQWRFYYRVRRVLSGSPSVSLIVRLDEEGGAMSEWYARMAAFLAHEPLDIHLISNGKVPQGFILELEHTRHQVQIHAARDFAGQAAMYDRIARQCSSPYLLFVASGFVPGGSEWIRSLLELAQDPAVGAVTGYIEPRHERENRFAITADMSWQRYRDFFLEASRDINNVYCEQNVLSVPIDLCMVRRELFELVGGFDEKCFPRIFFDMDFSLKLRRQGYANIYTPYCRGQRFGNIQATGNSDSAAGEMQHFREMWYEVLKNGDPYYNPGKILADKKISREQWLEWYTGSTPPRKEK